MNHRFRLTGSADFQRVHRSGKAVRHPLLVMVFLPNELEALRIGVVAGKTVGKAVERNRAKRLIRHALQPYLPMIPAGWDILIIARKALAEASFGEIQATLKALLRRSLLLLEADELDNR